jgi:hypothetical protein
MPTKAKQSKPPKSKRGRPPKVVSPAQVEKLAAIGCTQEEIGHVLGISPDTITRNYAEPYQKGIATMRQSLRRRQYKLAMSGSVGMLIWLGKQHLGQRERTALSGDEGHKEPIQIRIVRG